ncbi:MAG: hypothetical protein ACRC4T_23320 [Cetobacterium sp.]
MIKKRNFLLVFGIILISSNIYSNDLNNDVKEQEEVLEETFEVEGNIPSGKSIFFENGGEIRVEKNKNARRKIDESEKQISEGDKEGASKKEQSKSELETEKKREK